MMKMNFKSLTSYLANLKQKSNGRSLLAVPVIILLTILTLIMLVLLYGIHFLLFVFLLYRTDLSYPLARIVAFFPFMLESLVIYGCFVNLAKKIIKYFM